MKKFSLDYNDLSKSVDNKTFKLSDVQHKLEKVAFDIVRFKDGDPEELWQVQDADDGQYIVARYNEEVPLEPKVASKNPWEVVSSNDSINIFYKGNPLAKLTATKLGFNKDQMIVATKFLPASLNSDKSLVNAFLKELSTDLKQEILQKYPELS